jgi:lipopolysaccharide export system ATP-binding protein
MATLRTEDLNKSYSGRTVVKGVSIEVASGEVVGLLGPNGAGKTTTFSMVVGLTAPDSGRVLLDGTDVTDDAMYVRARKGIGYLPQEASIFRGLSVEDNITAILETLPLDASARRARRTELLAELGRRRSRKRRRTPCREGNGAASRSPARWSSPRSSCSWTSRSRASIRSPSPTSRRSSST